MTTILNLLSIITAAVEGRMRIALATGGSGTLNEKESWVSAERLFRQAEQSGLRLPILFATATPVDGADYWALVTAVELHKQGTSYFYERLISLGPSLALETMRQPDNGHPVNAAAIRPYAIIHTPEALLS